VCVCVVPWHCVFIYVHFCPLHVHRLSVTVCIAFTDYDDDYDDDFGSFSPKSPSPSLGMI